MSRTRKSARFDAGNHVLFKKANGWFEGKIVELVTRNEGVYYRIANASCGHVQGILYADNDSVVRVLPENKTPDPASFDASCLPAPVDLYAYEYTGVVNEMEEENPGEFAAQLEKRPEVRSTCTNLDGSISMTLAGGRSYSVVMGGIPSEFVYGVHAEAIVHYGPIIHLRRRVRDGIRIPDVLATFESIVPTKQSLKELEEAATHDHSKMLQLADSLMYGIHGWPRDPTRACNCYRAAAFGCSEDEQERREGIPVGVPEAFCAAAFVLGGYMKTRMLGLDVFEPLDAVRLISMVRNKPQATSILHQTFWWLSEAVKRGWVCPLALD